LQLSFIGEKLRLSLRVFSQKNKEMMTNKKLSSSFRDPSGFLFFRDGLIYRQVNTIYKENYDRLINSGLYETLVHGELLISHDEVDVGQARSDKIYKIIKPELIPFISYPYEWCFSQLKDAALTTLKIQKKSLDFGMSLKDCSAYNIQFRKGKPVFIDTLSFEKYREGQPWVAYRQFCHHFLAPLALMSYKDIRLNQLFRVYLDGVPLDLASSLLPFRTRFSRIASDKGIQTISFDIDPAAVEKNYLECVRKGETNIFPLLLDLTNPSPNIGWENQERMSLFERGPADTVFALALIHHLAISNNLPLNKIANLLSRVCNSLIIEFVPKRDSQVQRLLSTREDIFPDYIEQVFEGEFLKYFTIENSVRIRDSERTLYLMQRRKCT